MQGRKLLYMDTRHRGRRSSLRERRYRLRLRLRQRLRLRSQVVVARIDTMKPPVKVNDLLAFV